MILNESWNKGYEFKALNETQNKEFKRQDKFWNRKNGFKSLNETWKKRYEYRCLNES